MATLKSGYIDEIGAEAGNQIRRVKRLCGGEKETEKSTKEDVKECKVEVSPRTLLSRTSGAVVTDVFKRASGE
jgi:hypothetical protein